jgi:hypothetical protein
MRSGTKSPLESSRAAIHSLTQPSRGWQPASGLLTWDGSRATTGPIRRVSVSDSEEFGYPCKLVGLQLAIAYWSSSQSFASIAIIVAPSNVAEQLDNGLRYG